MAVADPLVIRIMTKVNGLVKTDICLAREAQPAHLSATSVYTGDHFALFSQHPLPPSSGGATGRDSLESKVTFIQPTEWRSLLECVTDKDFYSGGNSPESGADSP